jgi:apolipoprotein D and lipocalin family protein
VTRALVALMLLGACSAVQGPEMNTGLRNPTVALGGTTRFRAGHFAGDWHTQACLGTCAPMVSYGVVGPDAIWRKAEGETTQYQISAPGILRGSDSKETLVVMWVDEGFRTAVVGDADGRWAAIIERGKKSSPDRLRAATEILDFNGWDVSQLRKGV